MPDALQGTLQSSLGTAYTIERELGGGGMSRVFVANDTSLGRPIVIKVLPPETAGAVSTGRFKREIQLAARLQHPHIVPLLSAGDAAGLPFFTMPFVEGESLRVRLARRGELPVAEAVRVLREIASALAYAHERGIVHRDIKPDNVLLSHGAAMVTDFGVAKALTSSSNAGLGGGTSLGVALGTPAYMSPEQASADPAVDHRADIYAFGVLAYELLTGQTPFGGRTPQGLLAAHVSEPPEPIQKRRSSLPPALAALVMRCLEKRPADRPQSAEEIVHALDDLTTPSGGMQPTSAHVAASRESSTWAGSRRSSIIIAGCSALVILAAVFAMQRARASASAGATMPRAIAVLPFRNVGGDSATQFFTDGMTDELTTTIANLPGIRVESRSATDAVAKANGDDGRVVGQRLGVGAVLEGKVRRAGERMRLTAQLTNVADGLILWSATYDRDVKDAFGVQDDVARAIASALRVKLAGGDAPLNPHTTTNPEAHDLYLRGLYLQNKYTEPELRKSIELFEQALAKDSAFAPAWAGVAQSWAMLADDFISPKVALPQIREALARGFALDSTSPRLRLTAGVSAMFYDRDPAAAVRLMAPALHEVEQWPDYVEYYAMALWLTGQRDSASAFVRAAIARDPVSPDMVLEGFRYFSTLDSAATEEYCRRLVDLEASHTCNLAPDRADSILAFYRAELRSTSYMTHIAGYLHLIRALVRFGRLGEANSVARQFDSLAASGAHYVREDDVALAWSAVGNYDRAFFWLERALASQSSGIGSLYWIFKSDPMRFDPRFMALAKKAGLPPPPPYFLEKR